MVLGDNLEGWDGVGGRREVQEGGTCVYLCPIHADVWQKPTQYCKAIIFQLKIKRRSAPSGPGTLLCFLPSIPPRGAGGNLQGLKGVSYREESLFQTSTKTTLTPK